MSSQYNGEPDNEKLHSQVTIASSTNATPIVLQTSAPHDLTEGDHVYVQGHAVNTNANGIRAVHVVDGSHIALYTSVSGAGLSGPIAGNGVGVATGNVQGIGLLPTFQIPSDGDAVTAASVNVGLEAAADAAQFVAERLGTLKTVYSSSNSANPTGSGGVASTYGTGVVTDTTWRRQQLVSGGAVSIDFFDGGALPYLLVQNNDFVELEFQVANADSTVGSQYFGLAVEYFDVGTSPVTAVNGDVTSLKINGSSRLLNQDTAGGVLTLTLRAKFKVIALPRAQLMQIYVCARTLAGINGGYGFASDLLWTWRVQRPTGMVI
jgi:hypothetical protein